MVSEGKLWQLYCGDASTVLPKLPDHSVYGVITDPPYSSGGLTRTDRVKPIHVKYVKSEQRRRNAGAAGLPEFVGDNRDQRGYAFWCAMWLGECLRILEPGGVVLVFTDWRQLPLVTDLLQASGFIWRGIVPWHKPGARPDKGRFTTACEYVVWGSKGPHHRNDALGVLPSLYEASAPRRRHHPAEKPLDVLRHMVRIVPENKTIVDPFTGAGTTGVAAILEGRRFVGIERLEHYCAIASERIRSASETTRGSRVVDQ